MEAGIIDIHLGGCTLPGPSYKCSSCGEELTMGPRRQLTTFIGDWPFE
jgi:hypothetical protein